MSPRCELFVRRATSDPAPVLSLRLLSCWFLGTFYGSSRRLLLSLAYTIRFIAVKYVCQVIGRVAP